MRSKVCTNLFLPFIVVLVIGSSSNAQVSSSRVEFSQEGEHADIIQKGNSRYSRIDAGNGDTYGGLAVLQSEGFLGFKNVFIPQKGFDSLHIYARNLGNSPMEIELRLYSITGLLLGSCPVVNWGPHAHMHGDQKMVLTKIPESTIQFEETRTVYLINRGSSDVSIDHLLWIGRFSLPQAQTYYVNMSKGDDQKNDGLSRQKAFKTISQAAKKMGPGSRCLISAGIYRETLCPLWSGTQALPIRFEAEPGERVILSGAEKLNNWKNAGTGEYVTQVNWSLGLGKNQLFESGKALFEARCPNAREDNFSIAFNNGHQVGGDDKNPEIVWAGWEKQFNPDSSWGQMRNAPCLSQNISQLPGASVWKFGPMWASTGLIQSTGVFSNEWHRGEGISLKNTQSWLG